MLVNIKICIVAIDFESGEYYCLLDKNTKDVLVKELGRKEPIRLAIDTCFDVVELSKLWLDPQIYEVVNDSLGLGLDIHYKLLIPLDTKIKDDSFGWVLARDIASFSIDLDRRIKYVIRKTDV